MQPKEKTLLLLALSGPIIFISSIVIWTNSSQGFAQVPVLFFMSNLSLVLSFAGFVGCIVALVNPENRSRPKLWWILLGLLDALFAVLSLTLEEPTFILCALKLTQYLL